MVFEQITHYVPSEGQVVVKSIREQDPGAGHSDEAAIEQRQKEQLVAISGAAFEIIERKDPLPLCTVHENKTLRKK
jgi:hypothetical protein